MRLNHQWVSSGRLHTGMTMLQGCTEYGVDCLLLDSEVSEFVLSDPAHMEWVARSRW
jgi:hypothetical protein